MDIYVKTTKVETGNASLKGLANINFGDVIKVRSVSVMESSGGELFVCMPSIKLSAPDKNGNSFSNVCNPITAEYRTLLINAVMESYHSGKPVKVSDGDERKMEVRVSLLDINENGPKAKAKIYINDGFVINRITIREGKNGHLFAAMPSYKTNQVDENGKPVYQEFISAATTKARDQIQEAVIAEYHREIEAEQGMDDNPFVNHEDIPPWKENQEDTPLNEEFYENENNDNIQQKLEKGRSKASTEKSTAENHNKTKTKGKESR